MIRRLLGEPLVFEEAGDGDDKDAYLLCEARARGAGLDVGRLEGALARGCRFLVPLRMSCWAGRGRAGGETSNGGRSRSSSRTGGGRAGGGVLSDECGGDGRGGWEMTEGPTYREGQPGMRMDPG